MDKNLVTSSSFVSVAASGDNWRDIGKNILEQIDSVKTDGFKPNVGFLYVTESLVDDSSTLLTLLKSVTGIHNWSGTSAVGVCGSGVEYIDVPAASVLIGQIADNDVQPFHANSQNYKQIKQDIDPWLNKNDPMLVMMHANPMRSDNIIHAIEEIDSIVGGFMVGGLSSARTKAAVFGHHEDGSGVSGFVFSDAVEVATTLSQGCTPMGGLHQISKIDDHVIGHLDDRPAFEVFSEDLQSIMQKKLGYDPEKNLMEKGELRPDFDMMLQGEAHIAFPVMGSDNNDFMVRNILGIDPETGVIAVNEIVCDGQTMMFVHRDDETVKADLSSSLIALRKRVMAQKGGFNPKAAIYVSCVARANVDFNGRKKGGGEMALVREILGDIPLAGFYAGGEISAGRIYGHTGVVILFL